MKNPSHYKAGQFVCEPFEAARMLERSAYSRCTVESAHFAPRGSSHYPLRLRGRERSSSHSLELGSWVSCLRPPRFAYYFIFKFYFMSVDVLPACMSMHQMQACCPWSTKEGIRFPALELEMAVSHMWVLSIKLLSQLSTLHWFIF